MTKMTSDLTDFDTLALRVAEEIYERKPMYPELIIKQARLLREEWVKGLKPVAWIDEDLNLRMSKPRVEGPLYDLRGIKE